MTDLHSFAAALREAATDAMTDDFPTTRHAGAARFAELCKPADILALIDRINPSPSGSDVPIDHSDRLRPLFDAVCDKTNWKYAIAAAVSAIDLAATVEAIAYFTGGNSTIKALEPGQFWVTSPGYYAVCGA